MTIIEWMPEEKRFRLSLRGNEILDELNKETEKTRSEVLLRAPPVAPCCPPRAAC